MLTKCLHPVRIHNPITGRDEYVPCRECEACRLQKSDGLSQRIMREIDKHVYNVFFTLTYSNEFVPRAHLVDSKIGPQIVYDGRIASHYSSYGLHVNGTANDPYEDCYRLDSKGIHYLDGTDENGNRQFGVVSKKDVQNFIKRLRYYIYKSVPYGEKTKIKYFVCSEYGPQTLRPHYHGILSFDSKEVLSVIQAAIVDAWAYRIRVTGARNRFVYRPLADVALTARHVKLCDRNTAYYLASYVTSNSNLPSVLCTKLTRPFRVNSTCDGYGSLPLTFEEVVEIADQRVKGYVVQRTDKRGELSEPRFIYYTKDVLRPYFIKCCDYRNKSYQAKVELYGFCYAHAWDYRRYVGECEVLNVQPLSFRNYLQNTYPYDYSCLELDRDVNYYSSLRCLRVITEYPHLFYAPWTSAVDEYVRVFSHLELYFDSLKFDMMYTEQHAVFVSSNDDAVLDYLFEAYPFMEESLPRVYSQCDHVSTPYLRMLDDLDLSRLVYRSDGVIDASAVGKHRRLHTQEYYNHSAAVLSRYSSRDKSKKKNNSLLNGMRLLE